MSVDVVELVAADTGPSTARMVTPTGSRCAEPCMFRVLAPWHHDQLLRVADTLENVVELLDLAVTWGELDYSEEHLISPSDWSAFLASHDWPDRALASRVFGLAGDIAARARATSSRESAASCI